MYYNFWIDIKKHAVFKTIQKKRKIWKRHIFPFRFKNVSQFWIDTRNRTIFKTVQKYFLCANSKLAHFFWHDLQSYYKMYRCKNCCQPNAGQFQCVLPKMKYVLFKNFPRCLPLINQVTIKNSYFLAARDFSFKWPAVGSKVSFAIFSIDRIVRPFRYRRNQTQFWYNPKMIEIVHAIGQTVYLE